MERKGMIPLPRIDKKNLANILSQYYYNQTVYYVVFFYHLRYLVAINFANTAQSRDYAKAHSTIQSKASFELTTGGSESFDADTDVDTSSLTLGPQQGVVVSWDYVAKEL